MDKTYREWRRGNSSSRNTVDTSQSVTEKKGEREEEAFGIVENRLSPREDGSRNSIGPKGRGRSEHSGHR